jgi:hypothetical protein
MSEMQPFFIEFIVECVAPDEQAAQRIANDVHDAALHTNCRIRDGRIDKVLVGGPRKKRRPTTQRAYRA